MQQVIYNYCAFIIPCIILSLDRKCALRSVLYLPIMWQEINEVPQGSRRRHDCIVPTADPRSNRAFKTLDPLGALGTEAPYTL